MIALHRPWFGQDEEDAVLRVLREGSLAGNGPECRALEAEIGDRLDVDEVLVVSSATHGLEIAMHLLDLEGGEVIVPSFTFPSVGNAILQAGGTVVYCDVSEPDLNLDLEQALDLVGPDTRALVVTHYAGHPLRFADVPVPVVEDAAHALGSEIDGRPCGTLGISGCYSFHQTKNLVAGEGGALVVGDPDAAHRARIYREKGTNRDDFLAGKVDHYSWVGPGSSLVMPEMNAALARVQLAKLDEITRRRRRIAGLYDAALEPLEEEGSLRIVRPRDGVSSCYHIYAVLVPADRRQQIIREMAEDGVQAASHFIPLHSAPFGREVGRTPDLRRTELLAASLLRLPIHPGLDEADVTEVTDSLGRALHRGRRG